MAEETQEHEHDLDVEQREPVPLEKFVIQPPQIRLPVRIHPDEVIKVQVKFKHPSRTGLKMVAEHRFVKDQPAFYVRRMEAFYGGRLLSRYEMTSALSDIPILTFILRATREAPLRIVFTSSEGKAYEVEERIRFTSS